MGILLVIFLATALADPISVLLENSGLGEELLAKISLSSSSEEARDLLLSIAEDLRDQQFQDDNLRKVREQECLFEVSFLDRPIEVMDSEVERSKAIIAEKEPFLNDTIAQMSTFKSSLDYIKKSSFEMEQTHRNEIDHMKSQLQECKDALTALTEALSYLSALETKFVNQDIKPNTDHMEVIPIDSFLQKDQYTYTRLIDIMDDTQADLKESVEELQNFINHREDEFLTIKKQFVKLQSDISLIMQSLKEQQMNYSEDIEEAKRMIAESSEERGSMVRAKVDKETECEAWNSQYLSDKSKRLSEFKMIEQALSAFTDSK